VANCSGRLSASGQSAGGDGPRRDPRHAQEACCKCLLVNPNFPDRLLASSLSCARSALVEFNLYSKACQDRFGLPRKPARPAFPRASLVGSGRHGQARLWKCRRTAEAEGRVQVRGGRMRTHRSDAAPHSPGADHGLKSHVTRPEPPEDRLS
jgi:hypothetical protein